MDVGEATMKTSTRIQFRLKGELGSKIENRETIKLEEVGVDDEMRTLEESHTVKRTRRRIVRRLKQK